MIMKSTAAVYFLLVALAIAVTYINAEEPLLTESELNVHFEQFKRDFHRSYPNATEEKHRREVFRANLKFITRHNYEASLNRRSFVVEVNNFTDLTNQEFLHTHRGFNSMLRFILLDDPLPHYPEPKVHVPGNTSHLPLSVDWTNKGVVTPVKNQHQCSSSWAFAAVATIEAAHAIKNAGKLVSLSEQNLIDCSNVEGNVGCNDGMFEYAYQHVMTKGIDTESAYPLNVEQKPAEIENWFNASYYVCKTTNKTVKTSIANYGKIHGSELDLQSAVATIGPIAVALDIHHPSFRFYKSGVYDEPLCASRLELNHGVAVVGYSEDAWKVKNSWGEAWGERGYMRVAKNKYNMCGIASWGRYPIV